MKIALLCDFIVLLLLTFFVWLFPGIEKRSRELCEDWWLSFSDLEPDQIGCFVAALITRRIDTTLGTSLLGWQFLLVSFFLSQIIFVLTFLWISIAWGIITYGNITSVSSQIIIIFHQIKHVLVPLLILNTIFDIISLGVTRKILRKASVSKSLWAFTGLIGVDCLAASFLILLSAIFFSNFYFSPGLIISILLFLIYLSFVAAVVISCWGLILILGGIHEYKTTSPFSRSQEIMLIFVVTLPIPLIVFGLAIKNSFYIPFLNLDFSDVSIIIILAVSITAAFPSFLNLITLMFMFLLKMVSSPAHKLISHILLRIAETKRGIIFISGIVLTMLKDLLTIMLIK